MQVLVEASQLLKLHHDDDHERPMLNREDLDPDLNITFTSNCSSKYINITEAGKNTVGYSNNLSIMHINCRSILHKMTEIRLLIEQVPISILAVTETWFSDDLKGLINILQDIAFCINHALGVCGGGVGLFIKMTFLLKESILLGLSTNFNN